LLLLLLLLYVVVVVVVVVVLVVDVVVVVVAPVVVVVVAVAYKYTTPCSSRHEHHTAPTHLVTKDDVAQSREHAREHRSRSDGSPRHRPKGTVRLVLQRVEHGEN